MRVAPHSLLALTAAVALTTTALAAQPQGGPTGGPPHAGPPEAAMPSPEQTQAMHRAAATAQRGFAEEPGARLAVARAIKARDEETVKAILIHEGFTSEQVADARVVLQDHTGGGTPTDRIKVSVTVTCCPMTITITVSL